MKDTTVIDLIRGELNSAIPEAVYLLEVDGTYGVGVKWGSGRHAVVCKNREEAMAAAKKLAALYSIDLRAA